MELSFRTLEANEIDVRVGQTTYNEKKQGCTLLLYKDARVDMALLDEICKPFGWSREHKEIKGVCYCGVGIKDPGTGEWVYKWDAGKESRTEKEKGEASDSFKRACVNWGIGRELYTAPFIWVNLTKEDFYFKNNDWYLQNYIKFSVKEIEYDEKRQIKKLIIVDNRGATVFSEPKNAYLEKSAQNEPKTSRKAAAQPQAEKPSESPKTAEEPQMKALTIEQAEEMTKVFSYIDCSENLNQLMSNIVLAVGQPYENQVRKCAAERGIQLATSKDEINEAYKWIMNRPGSKEVFELARKKGTEIKLQ